MRHLASIIVLASLVSCSSGSVRDVAKSRLPDPNSAQFRNITYSDPGNFACVEVNAKDRAGAFRRMESYFMKQDGKWKFLSDYPESHDECVALINTLDRNAAQKSHNRG